jgi:hypothetical protein
VNKPLRRNSTGLILVLPLALLILGLLVDIGFTRPKLRAVRSLADQKAQLQKRLVQLERQGQTVDELAAYLGGDDLNEALSNLDVGDPLAYLSQLIEAARLRRQELGTEETSELGKLRRTQFYLRVTGSFSRVLELVRQLEQSPRLASIDAMILEKEFDSGQLKARLRVSIYEPIRGD